MLRKRHIHKMNRAIPGGVGGVDFGLDPVPIPDQLAPTSPPSGAANWVALAKCLASGTQDTALVNPKEESKSSSSNFTPFPRHGFTKSHEVTTFLSSLRCHGLCSVKNPGLGSRHVSCHCRPVCLAIESCRFTQEMFTLDLYK